MGPAGSVANGGRAVICEIGGKEAVGTIANGADAVGRKISGRWAVGSVVDGEAAIGVTECIAYDGGAVGKVNYSCNSEELFLVHTCIMR